MVEFTTLAPAERHPATQARVPHPKLIKVVLA
jgi:hypothetical protein